LLGERGGRDVVLFRVKTVAGAGGPEGDREPAAAGDDSGGDNDDDGDGDDDGLSAAASVALAAASVFVPHCMGAFF
jgi:hypothetical protein